MAPCSWSGRARTLRLLPSDRLAAALLQDYAGIKKMIINDVPEFDDILSTSLVAARNAKNFGCLGM